MQAAWWRSAAKGRRLNALRAAYRQLEVLAIDDVHFLTSQPRTQDELLEAIRAVQKDLDLGDRLADHRRSQEKLKEVKRVCYEDGDARGSVVGG